MKKTSYYILSPHLDDAALSTAGFIEDALLKGHRVTVINIFTEATADKPTLSAWKFMHDLGYDDALKFFHDRKIEDKKALEALSATVINLGYVDALWRKKTHKNLYIPELTAVYPTYRFHSMKGTISPHDFSLMEDVHGKLKLLIQEPDAIIMAPYGIGGHVDHVITRRVAENITHSLQYYEDFPYNLRLNHVSNAPEGYRKKVINIDRKKKQQVINMYKSQVKGLFENGFLPEHNEIFYTTIF